MLIRSAISHSGSYEFQSLRTNRFSGIHNGYTVIVPGTSGLVVHVDHYSNSKSSTLRLAK